jgi:hypothetical protein
MFKRFILTGINSELEQARRLNPSSWGRRRRRRKGGTQEDRFRAEFSHI